MTLLHRVFLPALATSLLGAAGLGAISSPTSPEPNSPSRVASGPSRLADTVRASVDSDTPLTLMLPDTLNGRSVARYSLLHGPALSGVAGRSFAWIPQGAAPGMHHAHLRAESTDAPPDTLVVQIHFQP